MFDLIVIGAGVAGMTAALYALRNGRSVLLLEEESIGGQIATSPRVENFPSIKEISGEQLSSNLFDQISDLGVTFELESVKKVEKENGIFKVTTDYNTHEGKTVVIAVGVKHKHLRLPNEDKLAGHGISYCAICDGPFYKGEEVALVGDANTALQYSLLLSSYCPKVYVYTWFDKFFGDDILIKRLRAKENITVVPETSVCELVGDESLEGFKYQDKKTGEIKFHKTNALFVAIGQYPDNSKFANLVDLDKDGYIVADETCTTKTPGLFVAGDCRTKKIRQASLSCADGAVCGVNVSTYIDSLEA